MDIFNALASQLASNPQLQTMLLGLVVKVVVDQLKQHAIELDQDGTKKYKVPVQLMVTVCAGLAAAGDMYLKSQLATFDPATLVNFLTVTVPIYLNAMGIHLLAQHVKDKTGATK